MDTLLSIGVGAALSAACGFRVFIPLLVLSVASVTGHVSLSPGFEWIGTYPALIVFAVATVLEIGAYYLPWVDNLLDAVATPASVVAGIVVTTSVVTDLSPFLRWSLAIIAGGGLAGLVQTTTVAARATSTVGTAGLGNAVLTTAEIGGAAVTSVVSIAWPAAAVALLAVILLVTLSRKLARSAVP